MAEPLDEGDDDLIKEFTETLIGSRFTKDLEIYDRFAPEVKEEETETKEEDTECESEEVTDASNTEEDEPSQDDKDAK